MSSVENAVQDKPRKAVAYYRVSTDRQGRSGLGLEAQAHAVKVHAERANLDIVASYTEVESGRARDRPQLSAALGLSVRAGAVLVIARLDRLTRNVHFLSGLLESGVDFVACDYPSATKLTLHVLAAVAEEESRLISDRTKAALAAYKARGGLLGSSRPGHPKATRESIRKASRESARLRRARAIREMADLEPVIRGLRSEGLSFRSVADRLNAMGHTTRRGGAWDCSAVWRVLERIDPKARRLAGGPDPA